MNKVKWWLNELLDAAAELLFHLGHLLSHPL